MNVTSEITRKSIATRLREFAQEHGVSYATSQAGDGRLLFVVGDQVITPGQGMDWMDSLGR